MRPESLLCPAWSREELDFLTDYWRKPGWSSKRISDEKPGPYRSPNACEKRAHDLGVTDRATGGNRRYAHLYPVLQSMAARNYSLTEMLEHLRDEHGAEPSDQWAINTLRKRYPHTYQNWKRREGKRRSRIYTHCTRRTD